MADTLLKDTIAVLKIFCDSDALITEETKIVEGLGLESIDFVNLIFELEKIVNKRIDFTHLSVALSGISGRRFREINVGDIVNYLRSLNEDLKI
jgi:acyl carrier protein